MKNIIRCIDSDSPLRGKVRTGDELLEINSNIINDVLDYKFFAYDAKLDIQLRRPDGNEYCVRVRKPEGGDLGVDFEDYLMDAPRACSNHCIFCFIDQLPRGMRKTMYFKDDDARLSFLMGNYITLTNLSSREIERIIALHVSPVNVSVHTTDPELRVKMLRNPKAGESIDVMRRFAEAGIVMNCQIVCCPGINDGEALMKTLNDLEGMYPGVNSVSVVPVGLTRFRDGLYPLRGFTSEEAAKVIVDVTRFGELSLEKHGTRLAFCSDEFYIKAGIPLPEDEFYEEHTQLENGVGMIRLLESEFMSALKLADEPDGVEFSIATGQSVAPYIDELLKRAKEKFPNLKGTVYAVKNDFFGPDINVTGLITGRDMITQLKGKNLGKRLLVSRNMLRRAERDFLDDITLEQLSDELGVAVWPVEQDGFELLDAMFGEYDADGAEFKNTDTEDTEYYVYN